MTLKFIKSNWLCLLCGLFFGMVVSIIFLICTPPMYEAIGVFQPARVGLTNDDSVKGADIENPYQIVELLKSPTFYSDNVFKPCGLEEQALPGMKLTSKIKTSLVKGTSLVKIYYRSESFEIARNCVQAIGDLLAAHEHELSSSIIATMMEQIDSIRNQLDEAKLMKNRFEKIALNLNVAESKSITTLTLGSVILSKKDEVLRLSNLYSERLLRVSPPFTQSANFIQPIYAPDFVVFPNRVLTILIGSLIGLCIGLGYIFVLKKK